MKPFGLKSSVLIGALIIAGVWLAVDIERTKIDEAPVFQEAGALHLFTASKTSSTQPTINSARFISNTRVDEALAKTTPDIPCERMRAALIPHHDLATDLIAKTLKTLAYCRPEIRHIIILSPDHFAAIPGSIATAQAIYQTGDGELDTNREMVEVLTRDGVSMNNRILNQEHGIGIFTPFITRLFPDADIIPIVINQQSPASQIDGLQNALESLMQSYPDTFLIVSGDMSHYLPLSQALDHDEETLRALQDGDVPYFLTSMDDAADNGKGIAVTMELFPDSEWQLIEHKSSVDYGASDQNTTTYIAGFWN